MVVLLLVAVRQHLLVAAVGGRLGVPVLLALRREGLGQGSQDSQYGGQTSSSSSSRRRVRRVRRCTQGKKRRST